DDAVAARVAAVEHDVGAVGRAGERSTVPPERVARDVAGERAEVRPVAQLVRAVEDAVAAPRRDCAPRRVEPAAGGAAERSAAEAEARAGLAAEVRAVACLVRVDDAVAARERDPARDAADARDRDGRRPGDEEALREPGDRARRQQRVGSGPPGLDLADPARGRRRLEWLG